MENRNYITIMGWMLNELKLKGNELIIYAVIYGFSQTEDQYFHGSAQYLADCTNSTKRGVMKNLSSLVDRGLIIKKEKTINGVKFCDYSVPKFIPYEQSSLGGSEQSSHHNIDIHIIDKEYKENVSSDTAISKEQLEKEYLEDFTILYREYPRKVGKERAFKAYKSWIEGKNLLGVKTKYTGEQMYDAICKYRDECLREKREMKYIKQADTFFRNINDYIEE